ncbi:MAG: (5-formylfuran-3-yl)methyl phosphate synthase, partial [Pirellulales bacterium]
MTPRPCLPDGLLVSVRSVEEAIEAVEGTAAIVDIKEPSRGPLGRADAE